MLTILSDTLVDDDEDVRIHGAKAVSLILSSNAQSITDRGASLSFSPSSAKIKLLEHLSSTYSQSVTLILEAIWRLTGLSDSIDVVVRTDMTQMTKTAAMTEEDTFDLRLPPVSKLLEKATYLQNVVFEEEKQNLFIDPVTEAESWAQILINITLDVWPPNLTINLRDWTESGLDCLLNALEEGGDSSLGLTSKADVYALFMQVVLMTRVLLLVGPRSLKEHQDSHRDGDHLRMAKRLRNLFERGQKQDLHVLILDRVQRVLEEVGQVVDQRKWFDEQGDLLLSNLRIK